MAQTLRAINQQDLEISGFCRGGCPVFFSVSTRSFGKRGVSPGGRDITRQWIVTTRRRRCRSRGGNGRRTPRPAPKCPGRPTPCSLQRCRCARTIPAARCWRRPWADGELSLLRRGLACMSAESRLLSVIPRLYCMGISDWAVLTSGMRLPSSNA